MPNGKWARAIEPRYLWCEDCQTLVSGAVPIEENSPRFPKALVKGPFGRPGHTVTVLHRSAVRAFAGDLTAADALERLLIHRATVSDMGQTLCC